MINKIDVVNVNETAIDNRLEKLKEWLLKRNAGEVDVVYKSTKQKWEEDKTSLRKSI